MSGLYELIGKITVAVIAILFIAVVGAVIIAALMFAWSRFWTAVSNKMYEGYTLDDEPPVWRLKVSGVSLALARFEFRNVIPAYREADDLTENDESFREYLKEVFVD